MGPAVCAAGIRRWEFFIKSSGKKSSLFPLVLTASSGLGVDCAFTRGKMWPRANTPPGPWCGAVLARLRAGIVLAAVSHLDVVRTAVLKQSHKNLEPAVPALGMI